MPRITALNVVHRVIAATARRAPVIDGPRGRMTVVRRRAADPMTAEIRAANSRSAGNMLRACNTESFRLRLNFFLIKKCWPRWCGRFTTRNGPIR